MKKMLPAIFGLSILLPLPAPDFWKYSISLPMLTWINNIGRSLPFSLLEVLMIILLSWLVIGFVRRCLKKDCLRAMSCLFKRCLCILLTGICAFCVLWLPLYPTHPLSITSSESRIKACADALIHTLNTNLPDFSAVPENLPAKFARFPFWMRMLNITGFYSFLTGEALISPDLPGCAIPFVAVHEAAHGQGIADEGRCNIAAYEQCITLGEPYASSARLWALRYLLGELSPAACADSLNRMNGEIRSLFQSMGGIYEKPRSDTAQHIMQNAFMGRYEILAHHLAANTAECYNVGSSDERK